MTRNTIRLAYLIEVMISCAVGFGIARLDWSNTLGFMLVRPTALG